MQTKHVGEFIVHHNGDYSGKVAIHDHGGKLIAEVPFWLMAVLVADKVRIDRVAAIEDAGYDEILGLRPKGGPTYDVG